MGADLRQHGAGRAHRRGRERHGHPLDLLHPYALLGALATLSLFTLHGALFAALKTKGVVRDRARAKVRPLANVTTVVVGAFLFWTQVHHGRQICGLIVLGVAVVALVATVKQSATHHDGRAFALSAVAVAATVAVLFLSLLPDVMPSSTDPARSLTVAGPPAPERLLGLVGAGNLNTIRR
ncbi:cytochrome d ubiquinol oxidase subunit II [Streptomyces sp. ZAF1911]|uniref:cytochrome d ubiquinol oxidase subunit II n=1 Tax=Streptomyces sp. ZAF1911 TaxID=2944129 RepID=UPI00237A3A66|nr:cytochrome d ubiquinol oxidase subunit II [Streptomyces sp. ZAF1911]MDD9379672.1 cytochrome d ubiquinol oxidase subunit II [Streptomyces sp. ZAF1911]